MAKVDAVFIDRDGVLNRYLPGAYVERPSQLELTPGAARAIRRLNDAQVPVIVISNQQGVGKGIMTRADLDLVDEYMRSALRNETGATLGRSYYCPHLKDAACMCRKPQPGMILEATRDYSVSPSNSAFIGDSEGDMRAAKAAGVGIKILVLGGATATYQAGDFKIEPDSIFNSIEPAVEWLLEDPK